MDNILAEEWAKHEYDTVHSTTFEYQQGYDDAMADSSNKDEALWGSFMFMSLIWIIVCLRFWRPRAFTHPYQ